MPTLQYPVRRGGRGRHCIELFHQDCMKLFWVFDGHSFFVPHIIEGPQSIESIAKADDFETNQIGLLETICYFIV